MGEKEGRKSREEMGVVASDGEATLHSPSSSRFLVKHVALECLEGEGGKSGTPSSWGKGAGGQGRGRTLSSWGKGKGSRERVGPSVRVAGGWGAGKG